MNPILQRARDQLDGAVPDETWPGPDVVLTVQRKVWRECGGTDNPKRRIDHDTGKPMPTGGQVFCGATPHHFWWVANVRATGTFAELMEQ